MTKVSSIPKTAIPSTHSQPEEGSEGEEEDDMASHSTEDPVRPGPGFACCSMAIDPHADSSPKVRDWLDWPS